MTFGRAFEKAKVFDPDTKYSGSVVKSEDLGLFGGEVPYDHGCFLTLRNFETKALLLRLKLSVFEDLTFEGSCGFPTSRSHFLDQTQLFDLW